MSSDNSGNSGFSRVVNVASSIDELNVGSLVAGTVSVAGQVTVIGYQPTNATTAAAPFWLNNVPGLVAQTTTTTPLATTLILPKGATIIRVNVGNNGTAVVGGTSFGIGPYTFGTATASVTIATAIPILNVNLPGMGLFGTFNAFATAGGTAGGAVSLGADSGITITPASTVTAGLVVVTITYAI
jgi:hypothetical protein